MTADRYPIEILDEDDDDGTMPENVAEFADHVVGHRIVMAEQESSRFILTLDNGKRVSLHNSSDCCAYTDLAGFFLDPSAVDHIILGVGTTEEYSTWHVFADFGDILRLNVEWSCGNPFYYGYGFSIDVEDIATADA
jgi:hypothetical protein